MKKRLAIVLVLALLVSSLPGQPLAAGSTGTKAGTSSASQSSSMEATMRAPSERESRAFQQKASLVERVLPSREGLDRINDNRRQEGLQPYPSVFAATAGEELVTLASSATTAQKYGAILSSYDLLLGALPASVDLSLSGYFPAIANQGDINACSSFATTYYAATYETAAQRGIRLAENPGRILSPRFSYNLNNDGENTGASLVGCLLTLYTRGAPFIDEPSMQAYQYNANDRLANGTLNPLQYREYPATAAIYRDALKNRVADVGVLTAANTDAALDQVRQVLNNGHVLVFGTSYIKGWQTDKAVADDPATAADDPFSGQKACFDLAVADLNTLSMHALTVVGYNDDLWVDGDGDGTVDPGEKGALKLASSWGSEWMNGGYIWLSYQALKDADGQPGAVTDNVMYFIVAQDEYVPRATAEVTISTNRRDGLSLYTGINWSEAAEPLNPYLDYVFSGGWGGPYSFAGSVYTSSATIVLDLTDAISGEGFSGAGGMISLCAGVEDDNQPGIQTVQAVAFDAGKRLPAIGSGMESVQTERKWYCGKTILNDGNPPPYDASIEPLLPMPYDTDQLFHSAGAEDVVERLFIPTATGHFTFSGQLTGHKIGLEIANAARQPLRAETNALTAMLYAGKPYVLRASYLEPIAPDPDPVSGSAGAGTDPGAGTGFDFIARIKWEDQAGGSRSARLSSLGLSTAELLQPVFKPDTLSYRVQTSIGNFTLDATPEDPAAYVVTGDQVGTTRDVSVQPGSVVRTRIEVTSSDWLQTRIYQVYASCGTVSSNADLASLSVSAGILGPAFSPQTSRYSLTLPEECSTVAIGAVAAEPGARVAIDGVVRDSRLLTVKAGESTLVTVQVTAPDQTTSRTYQIHVGRPGSFAPGSYTIPAGTETPVDVAASPEGNILYLLDRLTCRLYAADLDTGRLRSLTLPAEPLKMALAGGELLIALRTPAVGSDWAAIVDRTSLALTGLITTLYDIDDLTGDQNRIVTRDYNRIIDYSRATGVGTPLTTNTGVRDLVLNPVNGHLYFVSTDGLGALLQVNGQFKISAWAEDAGSGLTITPDGRHLLLDTGLLYTCGIESADDLKPLNPIDRGSQAAVSGPNNEVYVLREQLIHVYDATTLAYRRTILGTGPVDTLLASGSTLILGRKDSAGSLVFQKVPVTATLESLKLDGDAFSELYPLQSEIVETVANSVESIAIEARPAFTRTSVTAPAGRIPLAVGVNAIPITVTDPDTGARMDYQLNVTRRAADPPPVTRNAFSDLGFTPLDMARDPDRDVVYLTAAGGKSLYRVDLTSGDIQQKTFPLKAERICVRNGKIYLTLLRAGHVYYDTRFEDGFGALAVIDTATFLTERIINTNTDPFDIEADEQGILYLSPGANQHSTVYAYSSQSGQMLSDQYGAYMSQFMDRNPLTGKLYLITTSISPRDMTALETAAGQVTAGYDSPYHGDYELSTVNRVAPDGLRIFNGSGNIFSCAPTRTGDMIYQETLDAPFSTISFDQPGDRFYTASGKVLRAYDYDTRTPLRTLTSVQDFLALEPDGRDLIALQKTAAGVHAVRRYPLDAAAGALTLDGKPLPDFDPLVRAYTISLQSDADSVDIGVTAFVASSRVTGDLGLQPLALEARTYTVTVASEDGSRTSTYTLNIRRIASNNADLEALNVSVGALAPAFAKDTLTYRLDLGPNTSQTTITPVKTDSLATIMINGSAAASRTVSLSYNTFLMVNVVVTARDGVTTKTYSIRVAREPVRVSGVSLDQSSAELLAGRTLALKATVSPANATDPSLFWSSSAKNIATVDSSGVVRGIARGTAVITAASYDTGLRASCTVTVLPSLIEASGMVVDRTNAVLRNISVNTSVAQLKSRLYNPAATVKVYDRAGEAYTGDALATGMTVVLYDGTTVLDSLTLSVLGDISEDGAIDINDILYIRAEVLGTYSLNAAQRQAADLHADGVIDINDILYIRAHIIGTYEIRAK